ncbi:MAG TPA: tripartite tricarboxylate transporter substrate binding protein [Burkholderiales bacterium]|nr:tripartite tricarboxylate transporter substrate binding protein [Burkholderiales bacterium]
MKRLSCVLSMLFAGVAYAQEYPAKTVRILVPFAAGGSTDVLARLVADHFNKTKTGSFIVDNRPGATGTIAGAIIANSAPDGHTLIMHSVSTYIAGYLYRKIGYDHAHAFAPIINLSVNPFILVSASSLPVKNVKELVALAKRRPGELTYGTVGVGSGSHLVAEMINVATGMKTVPVPYKGSSPTMIALATGEVVFTVNNILDTKPFVNQGRMRALAVTGPKRSPAMSDVPTLLESGVNVEANLWTGLFAPAGTPPAILNKLNGEIAKMMDTPQMKEWLLTSLGGEYPPNTPDQFAAFVATDSGRWQKIVKELNLKLD